MTSSQYTQLRAGLIMGCVCIQVNKAHSAAQQASAQRKKE
jgi:hypothetical protein